MPSFYYRARDLNGGAHEGIEIASTEADVLRLLEAQQLVPVFIEVRAGEGVAGGAGSPITTASSLRASIAGEVRRWRTRVQPGSVALFARQLATMISAGLPMVRSLRSIARDHQDARLRTILDSVSDDVSRGESLATALGKHDGVFDEVFVSLVHTGEVSGTLDVVMDQTAGYMERAEGLRLKVESALRYPIFVLTFAVLVMLAMIIKIIPMFTDIYARFRVELPLPTRALLAISRGINQNIWAFGAGALLAGFLFWYWAQTGAGRYTLDQMKFRLPLFGAPDQDVRGHEIRAHAEHAHGERHPDALRASCHCGPSPATGCSNAESTSFAQRWKKVRRSPGRWRNRASSPRC